LQAKAKLENEWNGFQADTKKYVDEFAQQAKQQQSIFEEVAAAQMKAWRQAADKMLAASAELATDQKTKAEAAVQQMKAGASTAEANLQKLAKAGNESWTALNAALSESRAAFDRASQTAWDSLKRAS
jgi:t-SNARE complex subunit (syntaxin)